MNLHFWIVFGSGFAAALICVVLFVLWFGKTWGGGG